MTPQGIRATVQFPPGTETCPITRLSNRDHQRVTHAYSSVPDQHSHPTTDFLVEAPDEPDSGDCNTIFSYGSTHVVRAHHNDNGRCPCEVLGVFECPITRYRAEDGRLTLTFHASDFAQLKAVIAELTDAFPQADVVRLIQSPDSTAPRDVAFVDQSRLTARQREVLQSAYRMGYFDRPRRANATEIADALNISPSTLSEHLAAAQAKLLADIFDDAN